mgnify:CR=1 FL=1
MAEVKTKQHDGDVKEFILSFTETEQKQKDSFELLKLFEEFTGFAPKMWGPSIIGFGLYHYQSEKSKQAGDWPLVGFSPRKSAISLYVYSGAPGQQEMIENLGKIKMGKGCIYAKKLSDINVDVLKQLTLTTIDFLKEKYKTE